MDGEDSYRDAIAFFILTNLYISQLANLPTVHFSSLGGNEVQQHLVE